MLAQIFVSAKTAVNGAGVGQVDVPEIVAGLLPEQRALFERVIPVELGALSRHNCMRVNGEFFAVVVGESVAGHVSVPNNAHPMKKNSSSEEAGDAQVS